jgi:hypothetical protein
MSIDEIVLAPELVHKLLRAINGYDAGDALFNLLAAASVVYEFALQGDAPVSKLEAEMLASLFHFAAKRAREGLAARPLDPPEAT